MAFAQLTYRESLRHIEACLSAQAGKLYRLGLRESVRCSTLADANELRDWCIYYDIAQRLIARAANALRQRGLDGRISAHPLATLSRTITYDAASRITAFTHNNSVYNQTFGYDNLNRVSSWLTSSTNQAYGYDVAHNRTSITLGANTYTYTYPVDKNRLSTVSGPGSPRTYSYDADGNTTADSGPNQYQYDARGRLVFDQLSTTSVGYSLNGLGQRVQKMPSSAAATVFHYDQDGRVIAESTATGTLIREYFYLNGTPVALATGPSTLYFVYPDHLDTPRVITDASNNIRWRWDSADPFGSALPDSNPSGLGVFSFNLRFPGQYFDPETLVHYNYFRDYDPGTGRYIESDPIGIDGGINTYAYADDDPVTYADPLGLDGWIPAPPSVQYNHPPFPRKTLPTGVGTEMQVQCMMLCLSERPDPGMPQFPEAKKVVLTGGSEAGKPHAQTSRHPTGQAVDLGQGSNPGLSPSVRSKGEVKDCACKCKFTHGGWEPEWNTEAAKHYHFQNGVGAQVPRLNCDACNR